MKVYIRPIERRLGGRVISITGWAVFVGNRLYRVFYGSMAHLMATCCAERIRSAQKGY